MRATTTLLAIVCLFVCTSVSLADKKAEALAKIDSLIESGHLDDAKRLIDHLMAHNAGDPDLMRLNEKWKVRQGDLGLLATDLDLAKPENRAQLREACFLVVRATMGGNPEEWETLRQAGDDAQVTAILTERTKLGSEEERQTAKALLNPVPVKEPTKEELIADAKRGPDSCREALLLAAQWKVRALKPVAKQVFAADTSAGLRIAAAGLLLSLGDKSKRDALMESLETDRPVDAVTAARLLAVDPGTPLIDWFKAVEGNDRILRAKPQILSTILAEIGSWRGGDGLRTPGGREFLTGLLASPDHHIDAARALGALHDPEAVPALLDYLRKPRPLDEEDDATAGGLGYLGRGHDEHDEHEEVHQAEELRPILVGAIALLRATAP